MSDYQAIYDAVRSRISGGNVGEAVADVARQCFDTSTHAHGVAQAIFAAVEDVGIAARQHARPSAVYRPALSLDGNAWCALYGDNLQIGIAGFGDSPDEAMRAFDAAWGASAAKEQGS